jgi:hypothetical protein
MQGRGAAATLHPRGLRVVVVTIAIAMAAVACSSSSSRGAGTTSSTSDPSTANSPTTKPAVRTTTTTTRPDSGLVPPVVPTTGAYFGIWRGPGPGRPSDDPSIANMQSAEAQVGRKFAIDHRYYPWATAMPDSYDKWTAAHGRTPMISVCSCYWDQGNTPVMWSDIAHGRYDLYLISIADGFKALKVPMFFLFDAEPETNVGTRGSASDYVAAFRHVVDVIRARGATNVSFVWSVTGFAFQAASHESSLAESTYPGDAYVDWLGVDPYNFDRNGQWHSLAYEMGPWYQWARTAHRGKPLMLSEWGSVEDPNQSNRKAQWFEQASADLQSQFSAVRAVIYFDEQKFEQGTVHDWRIDTSASALDAFRATAHERWFAQ